MDLLTTNNTRQVVPRYPDNFEIIAPPLVDLLVKGDKIRGKLATWSACIEATTAATATYGD